jgi:hypothetical protein
MYREILKEGRRLWIFVRVPDAEPTNNAVERSVRPAVLWRKTGFGAQSERGGTFVEQAPAVRASCRPYGLAVGEFFKKVVAAKRTRRTLALSAAKMSRIMAS